MAATPGTSTFMDTDQIATPVYFVNVTTGVPANVAVAPTATLGQATSANSLPTVLASDETVPVKGATATFAQPANTSGNVVGHAGACSLWNAHITTQGTAGLNVFDNATTNSGTVLLAIPANAAVGTIYSFQGGQPAANGLVSAGVANCPAVTFSFH